MRTGNSEEPKDSRRERYDDDEAGTSCNDEFDAQFWLPPQPEDGDDDIEGSVANYDDDDDECGDGRNWGRPASLISFGEEGFGSYKFKEERQKALQEVMNGKLKALVSDLLKSVGVATSGKEGDNWVDIITSLSWEAASFVKPDATEGKMNPLEYVKIKCISTGSPSQRYHSSHYSLIYVILTPFQIHSNLGKLDIRQCSFINSPFHLVSSAMLSLMSIIALLPKKLTLFWNLKTEVQQHLNN